MPAGQIIGRISVKVLPDTDSFRKEAKVKLAAIEKGLKFVVPTTLDITGAKRDLLGVLRDLNAENKTMDSRKIRLYVKISTDGMRGQLAKYRREATAMAKAQPVKIKADLVSATATLELDKESLKHVRDQLEHWRRGIDPLKVSVKLEYSSVSAMAVSARLAWLSRDRFATIIPRVSKTALAKAGALLSALSGARMLKSTWDNIWDMFKNLDKVIPLIAAIGSGIGLLGAATLTSASNIFALASSLASIAAVGLVLPGILAGVVMGLGITLLAFKGIKKFMPELYAEWTAFKELATKDFWSTATKGVHDLATVYLPQLATTAKVLGTFWGSFAQALSKPFKSALQVMFDNLNKSVKISADNAGIFASVITQLGLAGSDRLPSLALWFVRVNKTFDSFLKKASADGSLKTWVDNGITALHDLGGVLRGTFDFLADMGRAAKAAGGSTLGILADSLARLHKVTSGVVFQKGMADAFRSAHKAIQLIVDKSGPAVSKFFTTFSQTLTTLLPIIGSTLGTALGALAKAMTQPAFQTGLVAMFDGIRKGIEGLAPVLPPLGRALGKVGELVGVMAEAFGPLLATALQTIVDVFLKLEPAITPLIPLLSGSLLRLLVALSPALIAVADALAPLIVALAEGLAGAIDTVARLLTNFSPQVADLIFALGAVGLAMKAWDFTLATIAFAKLAISFGTTIVIMGLYTASTVASVSTTIAIMALYASSAVASALKATAAWITQGIAAVASMATTVASVVAGWVAMAAAAMTSGITMAAAWVIGLGPVAWVIAAIVAVVAAIVWVATKTTWFQTAWTYSWNAIKAAASWAASAVTTAWGAVVSWLGGLSGRMSSVLGGLGDLLIGAGAAIINGLWRGMRAVWDRMAGWISGLGDWIKAHKGPESYDRTLLVGAGQLIMQGLRVGMESQYDSIRKSLSGLTLDIANTPFQAPAVQLAGVSANGASSALSAAYGAAGAPLSAGGGTTITVPMMPTNSTPEDVADALLFAVRRMANGGVYAQA